MLVYNAQANISRLDYLHLWLRESLMDGMEALSSWRNVLRYFNWLRHVGCVEFSEVLQSYAEYLLRLMAGSRHVEYLRRMCRALAGYTGADPQCRYLIFRAWAAVLRSEGSVQGDQRGGLGED